MVEVAERDMILRNTSLFSYLSPLVVDNEDDPISIAVRDPQHKPFLQLSSYSNHTVGFKVETSKLNYRDEGTHSFQVKLTDDVFSS